MPGVRRYLSVFWVVLLMSLKLSHCVSDGRAPLVEVLVSPDFENRCGIFSAQIPENSKKISQKSCKGKLSFKKDASANINPTELQVASEHFISPRESEKVLSAWF